jgi:hypothetical protein
MAIYESSSDMATDKSSIDTLSASYLPSDVVSMPVSAAPTLTNPYPTPVIEQLFYPPEVTSSVLLSEISSEIRKVNVDLKSITQRGGVRQISVSGVAGTPFSMTITDMYGNNMLAPTKKYSRRLELAAVSTQSLNISSTDYLEVGMQLRGHGVGDGVTISSIEDNNRIIISKPQNISIDSNLTFTSGSLLDDAVIPPLGTYAFSQFFPALRTYTKTLKTAASSTTTLALDSTIDLEIGMRMTGTGVDGDYATIENIDDDTQITVSVAQTIADETELTFTTSYNRYNIHIKPHRGFPLSSNIPYEIPTYYIEQYIDPIIVFAPAITLSSSTVTGSVSLSKPIGHIAYATPRVFLPYGTTPKDEGLVTVNMVATSTSGSFKIGRQPRFSDFTNTSIISKSIAAYSGVETPIVVLNNTTDLFVGMRVTGSNLVQPVIPTDCNEIQSPANPDYKDVTIKSITGNTVTLSWPQTLPCEGSLMFSNGGTSVFIENLTAVLSEYVVSAGDSAERVADGICTVTGTGIISEFGKDSVTCTIDFDNFLIKA